MEVIKKRAPAIVPPFSLKNIVDIFYFNKKNINSFFFCKSDKMTPDSMHTR